MKTFYHFKHAYELGSTPAPDVAGRANAFSFQRAKCVGMVANQRGQEMHQSIELL
jgi:hypothetical protein